MQREHIFLEADKHASRGVAADAAVGGFHARETAAHVVSPAVGDRVAEENEGMLVRLAA